MLARSEPAFGSEKPWHHNSSTDWILGRKRCFCPSVPNAINVGANRPSPKKRARELGAPARAYSLVEDHLLGEVRGPARHGRTPRATTGRPQRVLAEDPRSHSTRTSQPVSSASARRPDRSSLAEISPTRCSSSHDRTSVRGGRLRPGVSWKSIGGRATLLDRPVQLHSPPTLGADMDGLLIEPVLDKLGVDRRRGHTRYERPRTRVRRLVPRGAVRQRGEADPPRVRRRRTHRTATPRRSSPRGSSTALVARAGRRLSRSTRCWRRSDSTCGSGRRPCATTRPFAQHRLLVTTHDLGERLWWVGPIILLTGAPVPLRRGEPCALDHPLRPVRVEPVDGLWRVHWQSVGNPDSMTCLLLERRRDARALSSPLRVVAASAFNTSFYATRNRTDAVDEFVAGEHVVRDEHGVHRRSVNARRACRPAAFRVRGSRPKSSPESARQLVSAPLPPVWRNHAAYGCGSLKRFAAWSRWRAHSA